MTVSRLDCPPLIKPDERFSRIRLSGIVHRLAIGFERWTAAGDNCPPSPVCLRLTIEGSLKLPDFGWRCYPCEQGHRLVLNLAVPVDQVRLLRSNVVTAFCPPRRWRDRGCTRRCVPRAHAPVGLSFLTSDNHRLHSAPADPAVAVTAATVVVASPARAGFARLRPWQPSPYIERLGSTVVCFLGAHWMGFTFVADCRLGSPVALHLPSRGRSFRRLPAKRPNWLVVGFSPHGLLGFEIALKRELWEAGPGTGTSVDPSVPWPTDNGAKRTNLWRASLPREDGSEAKRFRYGGGRTTASSSYGKMEREAFRYGTAAAQRSARERRRRGSGPGETYRMRRRLMTATTRTRAPRIAA